MSSRIVTFHGEMFMQLWLAAVLAAGTLTTPAGSTFPASMQADFTALRASGRQADFAAAAREYGVPESVLLGVAYLESRWDANAGQPSTAGGYGPMHLVDAFPAEAATPGHMAGEATGVVLGDALGDARGDDARPMRRPLTAPSPSSALRMSQPPQQTTLPQAGRLIGVAPARLREDPAANIRAGAALLASYQEHPSAKPADWYEAIARYSGTEDPAASREFADEVFSVMREGAEHRTDDGHLVRLDPVPDLPAAGTPTESASDEQARADSRTAAGERAETDTQTDTDAQPVPNEQTDTDPQPIPNEQTDTDAPPATNEQTNDDPQTATGEETHTDDQTDTDGQSPLSVIGEGGQAGQLEATGELGSPPGGQAECPDSLACEWMPAAHERFGKKKHRDYGNHDRLSRDRSVDYIVIHDTEGTYQGIPAMIRNPKYVSWHYTIRSRDGHVAQHVPTRDIAWHAGNWDINTRSIGIEHEGYLAKGGTWYTEAMYRSSAKLVKYLADKYDIPLNRAHILGHDNVPGTSPQTVAGMHEDPGPYWDWAHYFDLMGKPFKPAKNGDSIIIRPPYNTHRPRFTGCVTTKPAQPCPEHGAATVWLHKEPSETSPLVTDLGKHPGKPSTYSVYDHSARASTGQRYAVAARQGDWTAIWYLGQKAWFHNPASAPTAIPAKGPLVTPLTSKVKVYGRAYPEKSAYTSASSQPLTPLKYKIAPGQSYALGGTVTASYYSAKAFNPARHVTTTGRIHYHQIQLGHRVMFVMAKDVRVIR
ncbi:N-acetylmuramoyl-L-alanine amidase [Nonomuraea sp. M3C6]|uniref:N-acetylmuramoyl-L-alanine amidase n=1 Tax=Nonomuraea marmarensis TaxID=3351344 RepID=A0ABW7AK32_9ACTN